MAGRIHLVIATPGIGDVVHQRYMQSICVLLQTCPGWGCGVSLELITHDPLVARARNTLVAKFMDRTEATHLLFADANVGFTPDAVRRLILSDKDVAAGTYPQSLNWDSDALSRANGGEALATAALQYSCVPARPARREDGFYTADFAQAGFMLIRRCVFEKLFAAYPELQYRRIQGQNPAASSAAGASTHQYALFDPMIDQGSGQYLGSDEAFCQRWRTQGGEIWIDGESALMHIAPHEFFAPTSPRYA